MDKELIIGVAIAFAGALTGCSGSENPLQGTWQGTLEISGTLSVEPFTPVDQPEEAPATQLATLRLEFLSGQRLKLSTQPQTEAGAYPAAEVTAAYEIVEQLPDQVRLRMAVEEEKPRELQIRFTGPDSLTLSEVRGHPRLLPVAMLRLAETP